MFLMSPSLKKRMKYKLFLMILLLNLTLVSSLDLCSDTNRIDISEIPCLGLTNVLTCNGNISTINLNTSEQFNVTTNVVGDGRLNFTINFTIGSYSLVDCANNSASILIGIFDEGYGNTLIIIMIPAILLTFISLFISGRMFYKMNRQDEEEQEEMMENEDMEENFVPRSRLIPIVFLLFSFVPLLFMFGFVGNYLNTYLASSNINELYGTITILLMYIFIGTFLLSVVVWASSFIKKRNISRGFE